jgi:iron complex transport system permease protein
MKELRSKQQPIYFVGLALAFFLCCLLTLVVGETPLQVVYENLITRLNGTSTAWNPLLDERLPRLIVILCTGASLAVSGAVMQALFQNPLASPSVLGISCGGSLMVMPVLILEWHIDYPFAIPLASFLGCLLTLLIVYALSLYKGDVQISTLILTGIAVSTLFLAIQGAIIYALRDRWQLLQMLTEWEAGSTSDRSWKHVHMQLPLTIVGLIGCWYYAKEIDILSLGDEEARNLGVEVKKVRWRLFLCVALLTGGAIAALGIIAFFGLILPHVIRKIYGPNNYFMILLCVVFGSTTLAAMDIILRIFDIHAFSIGNISAILGGLFFLFLLLKSRSPPLYA